MNKSLRCLIICLISCCLLCSVGGCAFAKDTDLKKVSDGEFKSTGNNVLGVVTIKAKDLSSAGIKIRNYCQNHYSDWVNYKLIEGKFNSKDKCYIFKYEVSKGKSDTKDTGKLLGVLTINIKDVSLAGSKISNYCKKHYGVNCHFDLIGTKFNAKDNCHIFKYAVYKDNS